MMVLLWVIHYVLSEIFMLNLENKHLIHSTQLNQNINLYFRYVDDIFILFAGTNCQVIVYYQI